VRVEADPPKADRDVASLLERLPRSVNGYDRGATEGILKDLLASISAARDEGERLRERVQELERDLAEYRSQDELLVKTLTSVTSFANSVKEEAQRDAERTLQEARERAESELAGVEKRRADAEAELARLREIVERTKTELEAFLTATLERLHQEAGPALPGGSAEAELDRALRGAFEQTVREEQPLPGDVEPPSAVGDP
jgi:cell division septum initiation protein DivIVA